MRARACLVALPLLAPGCIAYEHESTVLVHDPNAVRVRDFSPDPPPGESRVDQLVTLSRDRDGSLHAGRHTYVSADGETEGYSIPRQWTETSLVYAARKGRASTPWLITPRANVREIRERDVPIRVVGVMETVIAASVITGGVLAERDGGGRYASGGAILLTSGSALALLGMAQSLLPGKNEEIVYRDGK